MKIYYIDAIVIPLSAGDAAAAARLSEMENKEKILEKICSNINLKTVHVILLWMHLCVTLFFLISLHSVLQASISTHTQRETSSCSFLAQPLQKSQIN